MGSGSVTAAGQRHDMTDRTDIADGMDVDGDCVGQRAHMAGARDIRIGCAIDRGAHVFADAELVSRVVDNVLDNAFRHTPAGGRIHVSGANTDGVVSFQKPPLTEPVTSVCEVSVAPSAGAESDTAGSAPAGGLTVTVVVALVVSCPSLARSCRV